MATSPKPASGPEFPPKTSLYLILLWACLVYFHYFHRLNLHEYSSAITHFFDLRQSTTSKLVINGLGSLQILGCFLGVSLTLWGWGKKLFRWSGARLENPALKFCMEMGLGMLFFNTLWLGLGFVRLWYGVLLLVLALLFLGAALWEISVFFRTVKKIHWLPRMTGWELSLTLAGSAFLLLSFFLALSPEVFFDSLVYHLATLEFWKDHHGIADYYTDLYSYYPFGGELFFMNGFFFQGGECAKMLNVLISGLCALAAAGWVAEECGATFGVLAGAMVLVFPSASLIAWTTQIDLILAFFFLLFLYCLVRWAKGKQGSNWVILAGLWGGGVLTVKYTALLGLMAAFLALFTLRKGSPFPPKKAGWALVLTAFSLAPWLLKNLVYTGDPFYPYLSNWFGGRILSASKLQELMVDHQASWTFGFSPWEWIRRILTQDLDRTIGPLLFSFVPFFFLKGKARPLTKFMMTFCGLYLFSGFLLSHQLRLLMPGLVCCFITMALVLAEKKGKGWARVWGSLVLLYAGFGLFSLLRLSSLFYYGDQVPFGKFTRLEYLSICPQTKSYYSLTRAVDGLLPPSDRILVAGDARSLYYPRPTYANSVFDDQVLVKLAQREKDADGIRKALREMGLDDIVVSGEEGLRLAGEYQYYPLQAGEWDKLDGFIQRWTDLLYLEGHQGIYRLRETPLPKGHPVLDLLGVMRKQTIPQ